MSVVQCTYTANVWCNNATRLAAYWVPHTSLIRFDTWTYFERFFWKLTEMFDLSCYNTKTWNRILRQCWSSWINPNLQVMIKILMCKNERSRSWSPSHEKRELRSWSHAHENQELRSWSHVHEKKSSETGAVTFLRRLLSPEIIYTVTGHIDDLK